MCFWMAKTKLNNEDKLQFLYRYIVKAHSCFTLPNKFLYAERKMRFQLFKKFRQIMDYHKLSSPHFPI